MMNMRAYSSGCMVCTCGGGAKNTHTMRVDVQSIRGMLFGELNAYM